MIPAFYKAGARFHTLAASTVIGPFQVGSKFGLRKASTDVSALMADSSCNTLVIATRHDSHASLVQQALAAGKHVFVEKPLCITSEQLADIQAVHTGEQLLMVGFNRRFAPLLTELRQHLDFLSGPKAFIYTCNAGAIPPDHWTQDPAIGGGRLLGEACHFVDLLRYLAASPLMICNCSPLSIASTAQIPFPCRCALLMAPSALFITSRMVVKPSPRSDWRSSLQARFFV